MFMFSMLYDTVNPSVLYFWMYIWKPEADEAVDLERQWFVGHKKDFWKSVSILTF